MVHWTIMGHVAQGSRVRSRCTVMIAGTHRMPPQRGELHRDQGHESGDQPAHDHGRKVCAGTGKCQWNRRAGLDRLARHHLHHGAPAAVELAFLHLPLEGRGVREFQPVELGAQGVQGRQELGVGRAAGPVPELLG